MELPEPFLEVRVQRLDLQPPMTAVCAGYETRRWRAEELARHLIEWLPDFALTYRELVSLRGHNAAARLGAAARTLYSSERYQARGESGELLLHVALRQFFGSLPAISKYYFKDSANDTVKGFDAVHVVGTTEALELWLGEVKFYTDIAQAINDVVAELQTHIGRDYLRAEFAAIVNKIDNDWPHGDRLSRLLSRNTTLDAIFDAVVVPVLLTYESTAVGKHAQVTTAFMKAFTAEVLKHRDTFASRSLPKNVRIHLILLPLGSKRLLASSFDERLKECQRL